MDFSGKRQSLPKVVVLTCDTKSNIPKKNCANIPGHTIPWGTLIHRVEDCLNKRPHPLRNNEGVKTDNIPKLMTANIPKILVLPYQTTKTKED